ncbi:alpha/beta hydrolase [Leifsonia sp. Leaf336]|uniref:alpha/beta hydrolase n=1 Tax=Leifsonia sp. Leaf336 TaxID=1736341 RepID=UPI001F2603CF|nr:alpha/beta hydrolase [Leifsonia sp. Leaf336]
MDDDPTPGEHETVQYLAIEAGDASWRLRGQAHAADEVLRVHLSGSAWSGLAAEAFSARLHAVSAAALVAAARHDECATAARAWASSMSVAQAKADQALKDAKKAQRDISAAEASMLAAGVDPVALSTARLRLEDAQHALDDAKRKAQQASEHYDAGQRTFADTLDGALHGALAAPSAPGSTALASALGKLAAIDPFASTNSSLMQTLSRLSPAELAALVAEDPGVLQQFWQHPPSPDSVAKWWEGLTPEQRVGFEEAAPGVLGNLAGLPYALRNRCNLAAYKNALKHKAELTDDQRKVLSALKDVLRDPDASLVCFNLDASVPMVAVGYGDLDTADTVAWAAPGMFSDAAEATGDWSQAVKNIYVQQKDLDGGRTHGVVGWLGYDTPDPVSVNTPALAQDGAWRFANELDGTHAARAGSLPYVGVVAHSYGTTMAADALTHTKYAVDSFTMLGSAGIDTDTVHSLTDLHVKQAGGVPAIYTTAAAADLLAPFGAVVGGRAEPNPEAARSPGAIAGLSVWTGVSLLAGATRVPKTMGGAQSFSSEGATLPNGEVLKQTRGHSSLGKDDVALDPLNGTAPEGYGYLDEGTEALYNAALTTLGLPGKVVGGLRPTE